MVSAFTGILTQAGVSRSVSPSAAGFTSGSVMADTEAGGDLQDTTQVTVTDTITACAQVTMPQDTLQDVPFITTMYTVNIPPVPSGLPIANK
jgi:hypothetical protein